MLTQSNPVAVRVMNRRAGEPSISVGADRGLVGDQHGRARGPRRDLLARAVLVDLDLAEPVQPGPRRALRAHRAPIQYDDLHGGFIPGLYLVAARRPSAILTARRDERTAPRLRPSRPAQAT